MSIAKGIRIELMCLGLAFAAICLLSFDYEINFPHSEVYQIFNPCIFEMGAALQTSDLKTALHPCMEGYTDRVRFYNWFSWVLNAKFRYWLFEFVPFHPSVSLNWLMTLFLLPLSVYLLVKEITKESRPALLAAAAFLLSPGNLSMHTMYFHAAKPAATLGLAICLWLTARLRRVEHFKLKSTIPLFLAICASLFWDEIFYVYFLIAPIMFFELFRNRKSGLRLMFNYSACLLVFLGFAGILVPALMKEYWNYDFDFFKYAFSTNSGLADLSLKSVGYNIWSLFSTHIDPFIAEGVSYKWRPGEWSLVLFALFSIIAALPLFFRRRQEKYPAILLSIFAFIVFQQLVLTRRDGQLMYGAFYWGSSFSLLFALWFGIFLSNLDKKRWSRIASVLFLAFFCYAGYQNNRAASIGHIQGMLKSPLIHEAGFAPPKEGFLDSKQIRTVWINKDAFEKVKTTLMDYPTSAYWLYYEALLRSPKAHPLF